MDRTLETMKKECALAEAFFTGNSDEVKSGPRKGFRGSKDYIGIMFADELIKHPKRRASTTLVRA